MLPGQVVQHNEYAVRPPEDDGGGGAGGTVGLGPTKTASSRRQLRLPAGTGVKFVLFTPQATLSAGKKQVTTHTFSPNPDEGGTVRAAWQHSRDTSAVWGAALPGHSSADPAYVASGAIPWLLITAVGHRAGPTGGDTLTATTFIQRLNTTGGVAPATGCQSSADIGKSAFVPYTADYFFYRAAR